MAVGTVQPYDQMLDILMGDADRQWDNAGAGNLFFVLAKSTYTPSDAHTTVANLGTADVDYIATGDGAPVASGASDLAVTVSGANSYIDQTTDVVYGPSVTITAKYLVCCQPVTINVFASTAKLLWYVDLDTGGGSVSSTNSDFTVQVPTSGWVQLAHS